jgi:hypothetical protein
MIVDHGNLAGLLAYEDFCNLESFLGQLLSPWIVHAECHRNSNSIIMVDGTTAR